MIGLKAGRGSRRGDENLASLDAINILGLTLETLHSCVISTPNDGPVFQLCLRYPSFLVKSITFASAMADGGQALEWSLEHSTKCDVCIRFARRERICWDPKEEVTGLAMAHCPYYQICQKVTGVIIDEEPEWYNGGQILMTTTNIR